MSRARRALAIVVPAFAALTVSAAQTTRPATTAPAESQPESVLPKFRAEAEALRQLVTTPLGLRFLDCAALLPAIEPRTIYRDKTTRKWMSAAEASRLDPAEREALEQRPVDESVYYQTKYGTPLAYSRPLDLLGQHDIDSLTGLKILDFGYGTIGHLRMIASRGAAVTGLDVDSFLTALYCEPTAVGVITNPDGIDGSITLVNGLLSDSSVREHVGDGYDLIISKNTLKRGYIHPEPPENQKLDRRMLIDLGLDDTAFVRHLYEMLNPDGHVMIYNICPAPAPPDKPYIPWADGRCPFDRQLLEKTGFKVIAFDQDDSKAVRVMAHALKWDEGDHPMDLHNDLFAHYTLLQKPSDSRSSRAK